MCNCSSQTKSTAQLGFHFCLKMDQFRKHSKELQCIKKTYFCFVAKASKCQNIYLSEENALIQACQPEDIRDFNENFQNEIV